MLISLNKNAPLILQFFRACCSPLQATKSLQPSTASGFAQCASKVAPPVHTRSVFRCTNYRAHRMLRTKSRGIYQHAQLLPRKIN